MARRWTHGAVPLDIAFWGKHSARQETEISFLVWNNLENPISVALHLAQRMGLVRSQCRQKSKLPCFVFLFIFPVATGIPSGPEAQKKLFCRTLRDFRASLERRLIAVNRDSYVVLASLSTDGPSKN